MFTKESFKEHLKHHKIATNFWPFFGICGMKKSSIESIPVLRNLNKMAYHASYHFKLNEILTKAQVIRTQRVSWLAFMLDDFDLESKTDINPKLLNRDWAFLGKLN